MTFSSDFNRLRSVVSTLSLNESDFSDSDGVVEKIAAFKIEVGALDANQRVVGEIQDRLTDYEQNR